MRRIYALKLRDGSFNVAVVDRNSAYVLNVAGADDENDAIAAVNHKLDFPALEVDRAMMGVTIGKGKVDVVSDLS